MSTRDLRRYVKILRAKAQEMLDLLPSADPSTTAFRDLIINFNNTFSNIQQYSSLIEELEAEKNSIEE